MHSFSAYSSLFVNQRKTAFLSTPNAMFFEAVVPADGNLSTAVTINRRNLSTLSLAFASNLSSVGGMILLPLRLEGTGMDTVALHSIADLGPNNELAAEGPVTVKEGVQ